MNVLTSPEAMTAWASERHGDRIGLVPTMGFLHDGHVSLMKRLRLEVDHLVVSIYVNPLQFGEGEDLDVYPRDLPGDLKRCKDAGVDAVFAPEELYPPGFQTSVSVHDLSQGLCGERRPGHFEGVCTVVARLFGLTRCTTAIFGEKDYQQLTVLRRMTRDLALPVRIVPGELIRDIDGVALSSRNKYLSDPQRLQARTLHHALYAMRDAFQDGVTGVDELVAVGAKVLNVDSMDYLTIADADSLAPLTTVDRPARALVAGHVGNTRLIDNIAIGPDFPWT
jgi:pantoate--beta-alanine ligase